MKLLNLGEIKRRLDEDFVPLEPMLEGFRLKEPGLESIALKRVSEKLSVEFPAEFKSVIHKYDFGLFTLGSIVFCNTGDYEKELIEYNDSVEWWEGDFKPEGIVMIANSDPYSIFVDINSGEVLALDPDLGKESITTVASDFDLFLKGLGTLWILRADTKDKNNLANSIHSLIGSKCFSFWNNLAQ